MGAVLGAVAADDRAGAGKEALGVLRTAAVVDTGGREAVAGGEREGKPAAHAEADHADLAGAIRPSRQPGADSLDIVVGPPLPRAQIADDRAHAGDPPAPREQIGRHGQEPLPRQPVGLVSQIGAHSTDVVDHHNSRPRALPRRRRQIGRQFASSSANALHPRDHAFGGQGRASERHSGREHDLRRTAQTQLLGPFGNADHDVADLLACLDVAVGLDDLVQWIASVDDRLERSGLEQSLDVLHQLLVVLGNREQDLLAAEQRCDERQERILGERPELRREVDPVSLQQSPAAPERALADRVEDDVVALLVPCEVVGRVVDDPVGAQTFDQRQVLGGADRGHVRAEALQELDRRRADGSGARR